MRGARTTAEGWRRDHAKVAFPTPEGPFGSEGIWCEVLGGGRYRVANVPFFVYDVSIGDEVSAHPDEHGVLAFGDVIAKGGHATLRVAFEDGVSEERALEVLREMPGRAEGLVRPSGRGVGSRFRPAGGVALGRPRPARPSGGACSGRGGDLGR